MNALVTTRLTELETVIERGLQTFVDVGTALMEIRDSRLYRETHGTFEDYCKERWGMVRQQANRLIAAAEVTMNLEPTGSILPSAESQVRPLAAFPADTQREVWQRAVETAPNGKVTAKHVEQTVTEYQQERKPLPLTAANHAVSFDPDYDGDEWYTPAEYINAAREVMGAIDLDPASCFEAQETIQATKFFTKQDDALQASISWHGRIFLNPPYSTSLVRQFVTKLIAEYDNGNVTQAIILTNNSSDTGWFHDLLSRFPACFTKGRVQFWRADNATFGARQGQTLFYLGDQESKFRSVFSQFGIVVVKA